MSVRRIRTRPRSRPLRRNTHLKRIGTSNNTYEAVLAAVTAWYDLKEAR